MKIMSIAVVIMMTSCGIRKGCGYEMTKRQVRKVERQRNI
jgi:hypothetical protein